MSPTDIALFVAGIVWPFIFQVIKKVGLEGKIAQWAALATSIIIAWVITFATGGEVDPESIAKNGAAVATIAFVVYRQLIKPPEPQPA